MIATAQERKTIEWSYPTSPNAERFGFDDGCWTVEIVGADGMQRAIRGFSTQAEAIAEARGMTLGWHPLALRFHPEYAESVKGCGKYTHVEGTNGGTMPCGGLLTQLDGSTAPYYCAVCVPGPSN